MNSIEAAAQLSLHFQVENVTWKDKKQKVAYLCHYPTDFYQVFTKLIALCLTI